MTCDEFLKECLAQSLIKPEKIGMDQVAKVIARARQDLQVAEKLLSIDEGHAYEIAYGAMLHAGRAFMFTKGFRPTTNFQHKTVVAFAACFLGEAYKTLTQRFDYMRKNRNNFIYEPWKFHVSLTDAQGAFKAAQEFVALIMQEIKKEHPQKELPF